MAEVTVVESVTGWKCEKSESIFAGVLPETGAAQFLAVGFCFQIAEQSFPFFFAWNVEAFWRKALVILILYLVVHLDVFCRRLLSVFRRNVEC